MFSRRSLLLGAGGLASALSLGLPALASRRSSNQRQIIIFASGGWDVSFCLDPKLGNANVEGPEVDETNDPDDTEAIETFSGIPIMVNDAKRPAVRSFFQNFAQECLVVNGIWVGSIAHDACRARVLTGTRQSTNADLGAIIGKTHGLDRAIPYMDLGGLSFSGPLAASTGRTGRLNQLKALLDRDAFQRFPSQHDLPLFTTADEDKQAVRDFLSGRAALRTARFSDGGHNDARMADYSESLVRLARISDEGTELAEGLEFGGAFGLIEQMDLSLALLESGLCQTVICDDNLGWDTHANNIDQHQKYQDLFTALAYLLEGLYARGLYPDTQIVVLSEMSRTPRLNGDAGKDHWPVTSALLLGGSISGGRVVGGTNDLVESETVDFVTGQPTPGGSRLGYDSLIAGILESADVDPAEWLPNVEVFRALS